jgi:hypothetical protein
MRKLAAILALGLVLSAGLASPASALTGEVDINFKSDNFKLD